MYLQNCYPKPRVFNENEDAGYTFGARETLLLTAPLPEALGRRIRALWHRFTCTAGTLELAAPYILNREDAVLSASLGAAPPALLLSPGERYAIRADANGITLAAENNKAFMEGFSTLVQMIIPVSLGQGEESFFIAETEIRDAPAIPFRSVHFCVFPETSPATIEKALHMAGFLKFSHVVLEFWGTLQYECLPALAWRGHAFSKSVVREWVDIAHSWGMEVIPMVNHFGHASNSRVAYGRHTVLDRDLRLSCLFEPDGWTFCLSNPDTKKLLSEIRAELYELCGDGGYFHLGFDEAYSFATCRTCRRRTPHELLAEYINALTEDICAHGRRPIIWHDELLNAADFAGAEVMPVANGQNHGTAPALDLLDRRVIIADWEYHYKNGRNLSTPYFMERGFDTVVCPWDDMENIRSMTSDAKRLGAYGVMLTTWHHLPEYLPKFPAAAACVWEAGDAEHHAPLTETAALLRRLHDAQGVFENAGWNAYEVLQ